MYLFLGIPNELEGCAANCGNAFLHGITHKKYYVVSDKEFGKMEGQVLLFIDSICGLISEHRLYAHFQPAESGRRPTKI